jgi:hypothetical protein
MARGRGGFIGQDGLNAPDSPTGVSGTAGDQQVSVAFTAPTDVGGSAITGFRVQSNTGVGASGSSSPITVTGLSNGTSYTFNVWAINAFGYSAPSDASGSVSPSLQRAVFAGGRNSGGTNVVTMDYVNIATTGNAADFGDLSSGGRGYYASGCASSTRGLLAGGPNENFISYVTLTSLGDSQDFGDLNGTVTGFCSALSNSTRGVFAGGFRNGSTYSDIIEYVTIANTGNTTDFGDLTQGRYGPRGLASPTRGVMCAGNLNGSDQTTIDYITIASTGNATDFGDMLSANRDGAAFSSDTRGIYGGGSSTNVIQYITIASTGNMTDFGDLGAAMGNGGTGGSSNTRGLFTMLSNSDNRIEYVTIASTGNASDFGDLTEARFRGATMSTAHGGLQ